MQPSSTHRECEFCRAAEERQCLISNEDAVAFWDEYPVSPGHTLVVPRRHVVSLFDLPAEEIESLWRLVADVRAQLSTDFDPDGFNIGVNDGKAAGQTIPHAHVHVIPRFAGDVAEPRGGCRWVIPERAPYWQHHLQRVAPS